MNKYTKIQVVFMYYNCRTFEMPVTIRIRDGLVQNGVESNKICP